MSGTVQQCVVFAIVVVAAAYATLKFMPVAWRRAFASKAAAIAVRSGFSESDARRVEAKLSTGGACGSCDSCKACATPTTKGDETTFVAASPPAPPTYRSIPIRRAS